MKLPGLVQLIPALCLGLAPASAAEVGLLFDQQAGRSTSVGWSNMAPGGVSIDSGGLNAIKPSGFAVRGAITLWDFKVMTLGLSGTYHPENKADLKGSWTTYQVVAPPALVHSYSGTAGTLKTSYWAVGAQADGNFLVNLHAGLELRQETLKDDLNSAIWPMPGGTTKITRPWACVGIGYSFPAPGFTPFLRLEAASALRTYASSLQGGADDLNKALAPRAQVGLYGGVRF